MGDVFAVNSGSKISNMINSVQEWNSPDRQSTYNHAGIIVDGGGRTFEALRYLDYYDLKQYEGRPIIIARPIVPTSQAKLEAILKVTHVYRGRGYNYAHLLLFFYPPLARRVNIVGVPVCSELTAEYQYLAGCYGNNFKGVSPDQLADEWTNWKGFEIVFEGIYNGRT